MCLAGTLWNLSSYEPLKMVIIDHGLQTLTHEVIVPHSGWEREPNEDSKPRDAEWTTVFKNTSGCLRWARAILLATGAASGGWSTVLAPACTWALILHIPENSEDPPKSGVGWAVPHPQWALWTGLPPC